MRKQVSALLVLSIGVSFLSACVGQVEVTTVTFEELCRNRQTYYQDWNHHLYTDGVVVYLDSEHPDYFAVTFLPLPEVIDDLGENDFIIVKGEAEGLQLGSIISASGDIRYESGNQDGNRVEVYYLAASQVAVTGQVDAADPDFARIVELIEERAADSDWFFWYWFFFLSPISPLSPLNPNGIFSPYSD